MLFLLELDRCLSESLLTNRQDFCKTENVSVCLDIRRISPATFFMPRKPFKRSERKPRADAQRNRERILEVAKTAFTRLGADASLDDIAKQAGVGPGTLYRHFPTRDALIEAVYHTEVESWRQHNGNYSKILFGHPPSPDYGAARECLRY